MDFKKMFPYFDKQNLYTDKSMYSSVISGRSEKSEDNNKNI